MSFRQGIVGAALVAALLAPSTAAADGTSCAWTVRSDPDRANVAYPDESATYWVTQWAAAPGSELRITGTYPHARYFSFHVYEGGVPIDHLYDAQVTPDSGVNPFRPGADRRTPGHYTLHVVPDAPPAQRAANTLYTGKGINGEPVPVVTIIYRVYLGEGDLAGSVGLPGVQYRAGDGSFDGIPSCSDSTEAGAQGGVNDSLNEQSVPGSWPAPSGQAPEWTVARSGGATNPFFPNFDVTYLALAVRRNAGDVVAFRVKAPTFVHTRDAATFGTGQLRYWSICVNEQASNRYVDCLPDQDAKLDGDGWLHVVISDPAHKPAKLDAKDNWLPAGPYPDVFVLFRHMLPDPGFAFAAQRVPLDSTPAKSLGEYYPQTKVCSAGQFDADRCGLPAPALEKPAVAAKKKKAKAKKAKGKKAKKKHRAEQQRKRKHRRRG